MIVNEGGRGRALGGSLTAFLEYGEQRRPSRRVQKLEAVRKIVRCGDAAEKGFFFLLEDGWVSMGRVRRNSVLSLGGMGKGLLIPCLESQDRAESKGDESPRRRGRPFRSLRCRCRVALRRFEAPGSRR